MSPSALFVTTVPITLEQFLIPFARHFRENGWRVDAMANGAAEDERLSGDFDATFDVDWSRNPLSPRNLLGSSQRVREIVTQGDYDIVHVHTPIAAFVTRFALRSLPAQRRPAIIYTAHGFHFYRGGSPLANLVFRTVERSAARWTDFLITINAEDYEAARAFGTIDPSRVRYVPGIGVDPERYRPDAVGAAQAAAVREELDVPDDAMMLTMLAEFAPVKRHDHVLRALVASERKDVVLVMVGGGPLEPRLREQIAALSLQDRVRISKWRRDVPALLVATDALVLASAREGLPRSVLEAMSTARPVIGTATRGIVDAVGDEAGWIVPRDDAGALGRAMDVAAASPEERARRGAAGRERVIREFGLPRIIDAYEELYAEALATRV